MRFSTKYWLSLGLTAGVLLACLMTIPQGLAAPKKEEKEKLVERVRKSIDRGVAFLRAKQRGDGSWDIDKESKAGNANVSLVGGWTALALLALLNSGVSPDDPQVKKGLDYLRKIPPTFTYVVGLQTMVLAQAGKPGDRELIQRNVDWLIEMKTARGWAYGKNTGEPDNSNSQYALLGLHEAVLVNAKVDKKALKEMRDYYVEKQDRNGGWTYRDRAGEPATLTMTTAGLCNLIITGMDLQVGKATLDEKTGIAKDCGKYEENEPVAKSIKWLSQRMRNKLDDDIFQSWQSPFYAIYGLERAGRLTGQRYLGDVDWYRMGCEYLVTIQKEDGSWEGKGDARIRQFDYWPVIATSFSLLFLSKGRTPVLITKLAHGEGSDWNNKHSDVRHLVEFSSRELFKKKPMAWQVFDVRNRKADTEDAIRALASELLPSPIVYLNGHHFNPSDREKAILKEYLDNGGFVFAEACCGRDEFDRGFKKMFEDDQLFPDYKLELLPADHPVYTASGKFAISAREFPLYGVQMGCKTIVIYSKQPLAGYWEADLFERGRGQKAFQLAANIVAYATGLEAPQPRLTEVEIIDDSKSPKPKRNYLEIGQLAHDGDWHPAPNAMRNLMAECRKTGLDVILTTARVKFSKDVSLSKSDPGPIRKMSEVRFFYLHGRRAFTPSDKELKELAFNLHTGGTLLADACCGSKQFDESFRQCIAKLLKETPWDREKAKLEPIPLDDPLYSAALNGQKIETVKCRRELPGGKRDPELRTVAPQLEGVKYKGRWVIIYSKYDLGCALEKHKSTDCLGHDYASAVALARAAVLSAVSPLRK